MNPTENTIPEPLRQKFPNLKPLKKPPTLMTMNGIGLGMYGRRDFDEETQTYIKTRCICVVFIPLFAIDAYRVADAEARSWYFLGKESISALARSWNLAIVGLLALLTLNIAWRAHTGSPDYIAREELQRAGQLLQSGQSLEAARVYRRQLTGPRAVEAHARLKEAIGECLNSTDPAVMAGALRLLSALPSDRNASDPLFPDAADRGIALAEKIQSTDPEGALDVLAAVTPFTPADPRVTSLRIRLLQERVRARPDDIDRVTELALAYEAAGEMESCWELLQPYGQRLAATDSARILGQKLLQDGKHDEAYPLLFPYVQSRLGRLHALESVYTNALAEVSFRAIEDLRGGRAPNFSYNSYKTANEAAQQEMVDRYVHARIQSDPRVNRAVADLKQANEIVHVALELGIVQLNRAQNLHDPADRKAELEAAEKTFLAIRGFAGESDEYRMFLGRVYYWLGRSAEGRVLFDELLASHQRAYPILLALSLTLRSVGEIARSRELAEEAYQAASNNEERFNAASTRALMFTSQDDQISWLEKGDPDSLWTQIELNSARGNAALQKGQKTQAAEYLRKAISGYQNQPRTSSSLNNCALAWFSLHSATSDDADFQRGLVLLEEAMALQPGDSILLHNTATFLFSRAIRDVIGEAIHLDALRSSPGLSTLSHLYSDDAGRSRVYQRLKEHAAMKKALAYLDKALLLAPKRLDLYEAALAMHSSFRDLGELQKLEQRFRVGQPNQTEARSNLLEIYRGAKDAQYRGELQARFRELQEQADIPAVKLHTPTLAELKVSLFQNRLQAWRYGEEISEQALLQLANEAHQLEQSASTRNAVQTAHYFAAAQDAARRNPAFASLVNLTRRSLSSEDLITLALHRGGAIAELLRAHPHVTEAVAIERQIAESYPGWASPSQWALFRSLDPQAASRSEQRIRGNEAVRIANRLHYELNPANAQAVLEQFWTHQLFGDEPGALEIYRTALSEGLPLPPL